jgi:4-amino-4-deoxy-L-arabinose transferase-like glycosyltransferase
MDESLNQGPATQMLVFEPRRTLTQALRWAWARWAELICAALLLGMGFQMLAVNARKNITNDELVHVPAGYYHLVGGEFQLNNEHPPLVKMWAVLPLLLIQPNEAPATSAEQQGNFLEVTWSYDQRFWAQNKSRAATLEFWTRAMMIVLSCGLGVLIFAYARDLFGVRTALFAVALYTLEPTVLAHGHIVHTDVPAALAFLLFFFVLRKYLQARTLRRVLLLGLVSGLALITKFSMIVLLPVLAGLALMALVFAPRLNESRKRILPHAGIVVVLILLIVNAAYRFQSPPLVPGDVQWVQTRSPEAFDQWMFFFRAGSKIVPTYYLFGQYNVMLHNRDGHPASLLGQYSMLGWWYYFPVAFALKTSLPFLLITLAALAWILWRLVRKKDRRIWWLLAPISIYAALSMTSHINIGIRHFLPIYPFLFIAGGVLLERLLRVRYPRHLAIAVVVVVLGWMAAEELRAFPDYIPYMNQLASAHPHWWYLSDSNVEWGDDARALADYLHARGETDVRGALSGGWGTLQLYDIGYHELFPKPGRVLPATRYVAIGASFLNGSVIALNADENGKPISEAERVNYLAAYRTLQPEAVFGNSIYLYRVK